MKRRNSFKLGNKAAVGNKGGGRKPDWFINRCAEIIENENLLEFVGDVAQGKIFAQLHPAGIIDAPPTIKNRLEAVAMLKEWAFGKDIQPLGNPDGSPLNISVVNYGA